MFILFAALVASREQEEVLALDGHKFRYTVFRRGVFQVWVSLLSSQDFSGHVEANEALDEAFSMGKGFIKFAYLDSSKSPGIPRHLGLKADAPHFCVFHPAGQECVPGNLTARELLNIASSFLPDFSQVADKKWLDADEENAVAILFTSKDTTPSLWAAVSAVFRKSPIRIGVSKDKEFARSLGVESFPAILLHNYTHKIKYEGDNDFFALKATIKQFAQRKLQRVKSGLKVRPVSDFDELCNAADKICIVHAVDHVDEEMERIRLKHATGMLEFFFGVMDGETEGSVTAYYQSRGKMMDVGGLSQLETTVQSILTDTAVWNTIPSASETDDEL